MSSPSIENRLDRIEKLLVHKAVKSEIEELYPERNKSVYKNSIKRLEASLVRIEADVRELRDKMNTVIDLVEKQSHTINIIRAEQKTLLATLCYSKNRNGHLINDDVYQVVRGNDE